MTDHQEILAAFVDNEPVGAEDLAAALAIAEGRDYLIDLLVLRGLIGDASVGGLQAGGRARGAGRAGVHGATGLQSRGRGGRGLWLTAAAAVLVAGVAGGFFAGRGTLAGAFDANRQVATDVAAPANATSRPAPVPTHVIRMEKGVDWNERSGGN